MLAYSRVWASMGQKLQLMGCGSKITRKIVHCFILNALLVCGTLFLGNTKISTMVERWHIVVVPTSLGNPYNGYEQNGTENRY